MAQIDFEPETTTGAPVDFQPETAPAPSGIDFEPAAPKPLGARVTEAFSSGDPGQMVNSYGDIADTAQRLLGNGLAAGQLSKKIDFEPEPGPAADQSSAPDDEFTWGGAAKEAVQHTLKRFGDVFRAPIADVGAALSLIKRPDNFHVGLLPPNIPKAIAENYPYAVPAAGNLTAAIRGDETLPIDEQLRQAASESIPAATLGRISQGLASTAPMMAVSALPAWAVKLASAGFTFDMLRQAPDLFHNYAEEINKPESQQDPDKIATLQSDILQTVGFAPLAGAHGFGEAFTKAKGLFAGEGKAKPETISPEAREQGTAGAVEISPVEGAAAPSPVPPPDLSGLPDLAAEIKRSIQARQVTPETAPAPMPEVRAETPAVIPAAKSADPINDLQLEAFRLNREADLMENRADKLNDYEQQLEAYRQVDELRQQAHQREMAADDLAFQEAKQRPAEEAKVEPLPLKAESVIALPRGSDQFGIKEINAMPDSEVAKLFTAKDESGAQAYSPQGGSVIWGDKQSKEIIPELEKMRDDNQAIVMDQIKKQIADPTKFDRDKFLASQGKVQWANGALEGVKKEGGNYNALVESGKIKPTENVPASATSPVAAPEQSGPGEIPTATAIDPSMVRTVEFPLKDLKLSKDVPNFKGGASEETGTVTGQELSGKYERRGTAPIVVWQRLNGEHEVITGRHRFDLAKRTGETTIPAQIVREADGFTKDMALTFDAEANIRDGQGEVSDYATYFKGTNITEAEAKARGLLSRAKGKAGWSLAKAASDDVYALWQADKLTDAQAVSIANAAPGDAAAQRIGVKFALQGKSPDFIANVIKASRAEAGERAQSLDLFGNDDAAMQAMADQATRASQFQRDIAEQIRAVQGAAKRPEVARKLGVDVKDPAAINAKIGELKAELARWANWPLQPDLVAKVRGEMLPEGAASKAAQIPKLRAGEKGTGDLLQGEDAPFNLAGEKATDFERIAAEKAKAEADARSAAEFAAKNQMELGGQAGAKPGLLSKAQAAVEGRLDEIKREGRLRALGDPEVAALRVAQGAIYLAKGVKNFASWSAEMVKRFGDEIKPHLKDLWEQARQVVEGTHPNIRLNDFVGKELAENQKQIKTLADKAQKSADTVAKLQDQIETMRVADKWMAADTDRVRQGLVDAARELPRELQGGFIRQITEALTRRVAGEAGRKTMYRRAAIIVAKMRSAAQDAFKRDVIANVLKVAERALSAPGVDVRVKSHIEAALRGFDLKNTSEGKRAILSAARDMLGKITPAREGEQTVQIPKRILDQLVVLDKVPLRNLDTDTLLGLFSRISALEKIGRLSEKERRAQWEERRAALLQDLAESQTAPLNTRLGSGADRMPGDLETAGDRTSERAANAVNAAQNLYHALLPVDAMGDALDGGQRYKGFFSRVMKGGVNWNRQVEAVMHDAWVDRLNKIYKEHKLRPENLERINIFGLLNQGGEHGRNARARLIEHGADPRVLDAIQSSMSTGELAFYREAMRIKDAAIPQVSDLLQRLYNRDFKLVKNHWPMARDWSKHEGTAMEEAARTEWGLPSDASLEGQTAGLEIAQDYGAFPRTKTEQGFTIERQKGAKTAIRTDPNLIFQHLRSLAHFLAHQEDLKLFGEVARSPEFRAKYGDAGQKYVLDFLDTVARDGRAEGWQRWRAMDAFRRSLTMGIIPFNPVVWLVHTSQIPVTLTHVGPGWFRRGATALLTEQGRKFVSDNMRTLVHRFGSEPDISESLHAGGNPFFNMVYDSAVERAVADLRKINPKLADYYESKGAAGRRALVKSADFINRLGTLPIRMLDTAHAMTAALGMYQRLLAEKGLNPDHYATLPVDREALNRAMATARRGVASVLPEDMPQLLSRGKFTANKSNNISLMRGLFQFGNTYLDIFSNIAHDFVGGAIRAARSRDARAVPFLGAMALAIVASVMWEAALRYQVKKKKDELTGNEPKHPENYEEELARESLKRFPFAGQALSAALWEHSGVPMIDLPVGTVHSAYQFGAGKNDFGTEPTSEAARQKLRRLNEAKFLTGAGTMLGIPGAQQAGMLRQKDIRSEELPKTKGKR